MDFELDELKREFLVEAEEKVREIERILGSDRNAEGLERLAYLSHQLKGSGGSYGYQEISADAAELEKAVEDLTAGNTSEELEPKMRTHVANLRSEIDQRSKELGASPV